LSDSNSELCLGAFSLSTFSLSLNLNFNLSLLQTLRPCPRNGASLGEEAVLADSGRAGEITAGVGRVKNPAFLNGLR